MDYIIKRVKERKDLECIVKNSLPILFFGDISTAKIATLGINPSKNEILEKNEELNWKHRRFETLNSLNKDLNSINQNDIEKIIYAYKNYFCINPYKRWFNQLEDNILNPLWISYYNWTACHIDLVQSATDPIWRFLDKNIKFTLLQNDLEFLKKQLEFEWIETILINGKEASDIFIQNFKVFLIKKELLSVEWRSCNMWIYKFKIGEKNLKAFTWSNNLQSTIWLTNEMRKLIWIWIQKNFNC